VDRTQEIQTAHVLLRVLSNSKTDEVPLFYKMYRETFSITAVPAIRIYTNPQGVPQTVIINKHKAIEFLKTKFNFVGREERKTILKSVAEEMQKDT